MSEENNVHSTWRKLIGFLKAKFLLSVVLIVVLGFLGYNMVGINNAGHRSVVQYPNGTLFVKFSPGWYFKLFGTITIYNDVITYDFDKTKSRGLATATIDQPGVAVRYQDGGTGTIFGKARFSLPLDEPTMLKLHKEFRSNIGVAQKLIKSVTEEALNLTAGLMSSEEAYAEKRSIYTQWAQLQIAKGKFQTELKTVSEVDKDTGKRIVKSIPVIKFGSDGREMHLISDLSTYGIGVSGFQITDWSFEQKTLLQIAAKREATMAIITAKANAERAKQDAITAEEQGKANVMTARYKREVIKEEARVKAEQDKAVAIIAAQKRVAVAEQVRLEAEQKKLAAQEYKQEQILRGEGDAAYKRLVMQADGALKQKLDAYERIMKRFADEFGRQKWVPEVVMNAGNGANGGNAAANLIQLLTAKTLKDLGLDMSIRMGRGGKLN